MRAIVKFQSCDKHDYKGLGYCQVLESLRDKRLIIIISITLLVVVMFLAPQPVAGAPSVLIQRLWGGAYDSAAQAVTADRAGNMYTAGFTYSYGPGSPSCATLTVLKYSAQGNLLWQRLWWNGSYAEATGIAVDGSGNVYVTGTLETTCGGYWDGFLIKLDSGGNLQWQKTITQNLDSRFYAVAVDPSGNVFVSGYYNTGPAGATDALIMRFDSTGGLVWQKAWGGARNEFATGIALDSSDNIYVVGTTNSFSGSGSQLFMLKFNSSGSLQFQKIVGNGSETGAGVGLDSNGDIYTIGTTYSGGSTKILLVKFDPTGGPLWLKTWGGNRTETPTGLVVDSSGNLDIAGYTTSYGAGGSCNPSFCTDILMLKLDGSGSVLSQLVYGNANANSRAYGVADVFGTMVTAGFVNAAPPYQSGSGNNTLANVSLNIQSQGNSTLGIPIGTIANPNGGSMLAPLGSQTYAGSSDQILLRFGDQSKLTFNTSPGTGSITFNGTSYSNGQSVNLTIGNATATATPPSGYIFKQWNATGGVFVSSATSSTTQVTVAGTGTLTVQFQQSSSPTDYTLYYLGGVAAAAIALLGAFLFMRKKRVSSQGQPALLQPIHP
jgi:hypothetical protein